jgi:hypothetical protein
MKKILFGTILLALVSVFPTVTIAGVDINIGISLPLPPPIVFHAPPAVIVIPGTYVYVAPSLDVDIFFYGGWWWRPWEGRWYRSRYYDRGWHYYDKVPRFYFDIDPGWRRYYREHRWSGHRWNYQPIPYSRLHQNWKSWQNQRHWERRGTWGVQNYKPLSKRQVQQLRQQREKRYQERPEVQRHQEWRRQQQRRPQVQRPQGPPQRQPQVQRPQGPPQKQPQVQRAQGPPQREPQVQGPQHSQPRGRPDGREEKDKR